MREVLTDLFDLSGSNAIVTGGASGLGSYFADGLAEAGANVFLCARNADRCEEAAADLARRHGVRALSAGCDVRDPEQVQSVVDQAERELGPIGILVNNAGASWGAPTEDYPLEGWRKVLDVNLTGSFLFARAAGKNMIERRAGTIVNIASVAALKGAPVGTLDAVAYTASKGGVVALTRDLAVKWAPHGVRVNAIAPGWFPTKMSTALLDSRRDAFLARIPLSRFGEPDDLKGVIVFLASRAAAFVTGQTLVVDGGQTVS